VRFEDERYVRVYTRDTVNWKMLPWQAKAVLALLFRKVDRAGLLDLDDHGPDGLAAMLELPMEVVEPGLSALLKRGTVVMTTSGALFVPKFLEAQEAQASDAQRKRDQRERAAARARLDEVAPDVSRTVTDRHALGQKVTGGHAESQVVTGGHSVPIRSEPPVPSEIPPACARVIGPEQLWIDAVGLQPGSGILDAWLLAKNAAPAKGLTPEEYFSKALGAFVQWVDGVRGARRPQKSPQKFVEHFARVQEILDGKRQAVPPEEEAQPGIAQLPAAPRAAVPVGQGGERKFGRG